MKIVKTLKIMAISDLHGYLPEITEPADIALIAGDIVPLEMQSNKQDSSIWFKTDFAQWIIGMPVKKVFIIAGNHDFYLETIGKTGLRSIKKACNGKIVYLMNNLTKYIDENGIRWSIFGTPYCHIFYNWPFMKTDKYLTEAFSEIPNRVDIIISHDPPFSFGDADLTERYSGHVGSVPLADRLKKVDYKLLVCGHIHTGDHIFNKQFNTVNVSYLNEAYKPHYKPFYFTIEK